VTVTGALRPRVRSVTVQPEGVVYQAGQSIDLTGKNQWIKDDTDPAEQDRNLSLTADNVVEAANNDESFVNLRNAQVKYASSNPSVASVTSTGLVRAVKDGVATITVTVNGVSGSTPIVVQGTLRNSVPPVVITGQPADASATFTNGSASAVKNVGLSISLPAGWSATPTTPNTFGSVAAGAAVTATWQLTPSTVVTPGTYPIGFAANSSEGTFTSDAQSSVPYDSIAAAYDNAAISHDSSPGSANLDGGGLSYSAEALAAAGFVSGQTNTIGGATFTWPPAGEPDNIVAGGQTVPLTGSGTSLGFLGAGNNGTASGTGTIVYSDGTSQTFPLAFSDWWAGSATQGTSIAATTPYINNGTGRLNQTVHLYFASIPLQAGKTVQYVTLPDVTENGQVQHVAAMHIFAMAIG
jgi:beta-glucosidase